MTTLEDKLKLFSKLTYSKIEKEQNKEFEKFEKEKEEILNKEKEKIEKREKEFLNEVDKKAKVKANEILSKVKNENNEELLKLKEELIENIFNEIKEDFIGFTETEEYKNVLEHLINDSLSEVEGNNYIIYFTKKDVEKYSENINEILKKYTDKNFTIENTEENIIGGILVEDSQTKMRIDNTLMSKLEDVRDDIGIKVVEMIG